MAPSNYDVEHGGNIKNKKLSSGSNHCNKDRSRGKSSNGGSNHSSSRDRRDRYDHQRRRKRHQSSRNREQSRSSVENGWKTESLPSFMTSSRIRPLIAVGVVMLLMVAVRLHNDQNDYYNIQAAAHMAEEADRLQRQQDGLKPQHKEMTVESARPGLWIGDEPRGNQGSRSTTLVGTSPLQEQQLQQIRQQQMQQQQIQQQVADNTGSESEKIHLTTPPRLRGQDPMEFHRDEHNVVRLVQGGGGKDALSEPSNPLIPQSLRYLADLSTPYKSDKESPFFWHVPKSGGTSVKHMYSDCYNLVEACESGTSEGHDKDITLRVVQVNGYRYVNVDTTTSKGIQRASRFNVVASRQAQMVVSPLLHEASLQLFSNRNKGRFFAVFRDPLDRVVSLFYYLQTATWEPTYNPLLADMTLEQYVNSTLVESNFVIRSLLDKMEAPLTEQDLEMAQETLRAKCTVGLLDDLEESVRRFDTFFGLSSPNDQCKAGYIKKGSNRHSHPNSPEPGSTVYQELARKNHMDIRLHQFVKELFVEQAAAFPR